MTAITVKKQDLKELIREWIMVKYDADPTCHRILFEGMLDLAMRKNTLRELRGWLEILNLSSTIRACKAKVE